MARVTAVFLSCVLLTAGSLQASSVEETYQAALAQEKGAGNLAEAIRLYRQVVQAHEKGNADANLAARAQLRISACREKLRLAQVRQTYELVMDAHPDKPQVEVRLQSARQREATIEHPPSLDLDPDSVFFDDFHRISAMEPVTKIPIQWKFHHDENIQPMESPPWPHQYAHPDFDDSEWVAIEIGKTWAEQGYAAYKGGTWYRAHFTAKADHVRSVIIAIKGEYQSVNIYVNGQPAIHHFRNTDIPDEPWIINSDISGDFVRDGENTVALCVYDATGTGGIARIDVYQPSVNWLSQHPEPDYYHYANTPPVIPYAYEEVAAVPVQWKFRLDESTYAQRHRTYAAPDFDDSDWATINIGQAWEDQGYDGYDAGAWYRTRIEVDAEQDQPVLMAFGGVDKDAYVYVNGQLVGEHHAWAQPFILDISDSVVRDGENTVALYVYDGALMGGVYGLINVHQPTTAVNLDQFVANRGGHLAKHNWPVSISYFIGGKRHDYYASQPPHIPYKHNKVAAVPAQWKFLPYAKEEQDHQGSILSRADFDDSNWTAVNVGRTWKNQGYDEGAWYRVQIEVDAEQGQPVHLAFGGAYHNAAVYINGFFVGELHGWNTSFILDISQAVNYKGQNAIAVRVYDGIGMGSIGTIAVIQPTGAENFNRYLANRTDQAKRIRPNR